MQGMGWIQDGWLLGMPLLHLAGMVLAFLAGGLVAVNSRDRRARPARMPLPAGLAFGHEMKNYLCALRGNARLLRLSARDRDQAAILDRIDQVVARMETCGWKGGEVPDMVSPRARVGVDLLAIAKSCARLHFAAAPVEFRFEAEAPSFVEGDPQRLEQVFQNLYGNALEAGAHEIVVRVRRAGHGIEAVVEDNGRGCPQESLRRLFEPFYSTKRVPGPGNLAAPAENTGAVRGLGLFIVRSIVENHKGRVHAIARYGQGEGATGLTFHLHFPRLLPSVPRLIRALPPKGRQSDLSLATAPLGLAP